MNQILWLMITMPMIIVQMHQAEDNAKKHAQPHALPQTTRTLYPQGQTVFKTGRATYYSSGLMEHVAKMRRIKLDGATGFSTYPDCGKIGHYLMVSVLNPKTQKWSSWDLKKIVDCSEPQDYQRHVSEGLIELSYEQALDYGYLGDGHTLIRFYLVGQP